MKCKRCNNDKLTVPKAGWLHCPQCRHIWVSDIDRVKANGQRSKQEQTVNLRSHDLAQAILAQPDVSMPSSWTFPYHGGSVRLKFEIVKELDHVS